MVLNAAAVCALASASPRPTLMAFQMACGTVLASIARMIVVFGLYPRMDGFLLLSVALVPFLLLGSYLSTRRGSRAWASATASSSAFSQVRTTFVHYDPTGFINDAIALILSMIVSAPSRSPCCCQPTRRGCGAAARATCGREVVLACRGRLTRLATHFESRTRDLLSQINALPAARARAATRRAAVALRGAGGGPRRHRPASRAERRRRRRAMRQHAVAARDRRDVRRAVTRLFDRPDAARFDAALSSTSRAIADVRTLLDTAEPREEQHRLQRILSHLHFIRTALLDPQSPLEPVRRQRATRSKE